MSNKNRQSYSHSLSHNRAADDIKKGLERIKQAQIEVLRQLRKQDGDISRNHSLTYSKETTSDSKPNLKFDGQAALMKQKVEKLQFDLAEFNIKEAKLKKQNSALTEDARRYKQISQRAEIKMKQYQKGQQRALAKAQQALANAINSQKKYITLKSQYDKINKQRQRLSSDLKKIQKKQLSQLLNTNQNQSQIANKILKQLNSAHECFSELLKEINSHKCQLGATPTNSSNMNNNNNSANKKNSTTANSTPNGFTISTFDLQSKLDRNVNNLIVYLQNLHTFAPINKGQGNFGFESNNYLSGSFRDDIRKIQEELDQSSKGKNQKILQLQNVNSALDKKIKRIQSQIRQYQQQNNLLKTKIKTLAKQLQQQKLSKKILQQQYQKHKLKTKQKQRLKDTEIQRLRKKQASLSAPLPLSTTPQDKPQSCSPQLLQDRIIQLQHELKQSQQKSTSTETSLKQIIQSLKNQLQTTTSSKNSQEQEYKLQINKLNAKTAIQAGFNMRSQKQFDEMVRTITRMQQEREENRVKEREARQRMEADGQQYRNKISELERQLDQVRETIRDMRKQSAAISYDQTQLAKLRNQQLNNMESLTLNRTVDELWNKKQGQYGNVNQLLGEIKPQSQIPQNHQILQPNQQPIGSQTVINNLSSYSSTNLLQAYPQGPQYQTSAPQVQYSQNVPIHSYQLQPQPQPQFQQAYPSNLYQVQYQYNNQYQPVSQSHPQSQYQPVSQSQSQYQYGGQLPMPMQLQQQQWVYGYR